MDYKSELILEKLVFDKIHFNRIGFKNENTLLHRFESHIAKKQGEEVYRVNLIYNGNKPEEYTIEISLAGYFSFHSEGTMSEEMKNHLINVNTISILMPYIRSQISLLTAQPDVDSVVLPPFNINSMLKSRGNK